MVSGYAHNGYWIKALEALEIMGTSGIEVKVSSWNSIMEIHGFAIKQKGIIDVDSIDDDKLRAYIVPGVGFESATAVNNALIGMYARKNKIELSERVFKRTPEKDVGMPHDEFTFSSILSPCGDLGAHQQPVGIHGYIIRSGFCEGYFVVQNALVDMYGKYGCVDEARKLCDEMTWRDTISWNTMISCYGIIALPHEALLSLMRCKGKDGIPTVSYFIALLSACGHAGLVHQALHFFQIMNTEYGISTDVEHYACIVDNLGRAGYFHVELVKMEILILWDGMKVKELSSDLIRVSASTIGTLGGAIVNSGTSFAVANRMRCPSDLHYWDWSSSAVAVSLCVLHMLNGDNRSLADVKLRIVDKSMEKSKIWTLSEINEPSQCRSLKLPDNLLPVRVCVNVATIHLFYAILHLCIFVTFYVGRDYLLFNVDIVC
ncbi:hypothetical protein IFM89_027329 [Coptis chinensis]|uniref:Pentatricopeptide repeat-containing protein n=1 Tax=Coptis chinensis TaxID=261450 RepID=A0A835IQ40_9MAGN|nr:hypothetical protein IFM89_027329 [Coptis chinensis]